MRAVHPRDVLDCEDDTRSHIRVPSLTKDEVDYFCKVARRDVVMRAQDDQWC